MAVASPIKFAGVIFAGLFYSSSLAFSFGIDCPDIADRVFYADAIVVGRTIKIEEVPDRPGMNGILFEFQVQESLKGDSHKSGDVLSQRFSGEYRMKYFMEPFPMKDEGLAFVFLGKDREGNERASCNARLDENVTVNRMKRLIAVTADPMAHLDSKDAGDICVVLTHILRRHCQYDERLRGKAPAEEVDGKDLARVKAYLLAHSKDKGTASSTAVNALAYLDPTPPEAFDIFASALESTSPEKLVAATKGLSHLADKRAIPLLIERLARYRRDGEATKQTEVSDPEAEEFLCSLASDGRFRPYAEGELLNALMHFDDPRISGVITQELKGSNTGAVMEKAVQSKDERAVDLLVGRIWEQGFGDFSAICKLSDPRVVEQARERMYDHPQAPYLLACQGDPESKAFMLRLIRQGHMSGATWAAKTQDQSAKADLLAGLDLAGGVPSFFQNEAAHALGQLRAFDLIEGMLERSPSIDTLGIQGMFLYGLADLPIHATSPCLGDQKRECLHEHMRAVADREKWNDSDRKLAERLFDRLKHPHKFAESHDLYHAWTPPEGLADMPDPLDVAASITYFERNKKACQDALRSGPPEDQLKILQSANNCKATVLDGDLAVHLLHSPDRMVSSRTFSAIKEDRPVLTQAEIERWALAGDGYATSMALNFIRRHPKSEYAPIVVKVLRRGWHLFDKMLFEAIIETKATDAADLLRAYLENEHIALRTNSAITLVHLGDSSVGTTLKELLDKAKGSGEVLGREYPTKALEMVGRAP